MKNLLLFAILFLGQSVYSHAANDEFVYDKSKETLYWKFLKERLFDGERPIVSSFQNDILIHLSGASSQDSSIVESLMQELRSLIPSREVRFTKEYIEVDENNNLIHTINIGFNNAGTLHGDGYIPRSKNINGNQIFYYEFGISQDEIFQQSINIKFNDSISHAERKRYIEYAIIKSMYTVKGSPKNARTFFEGAILNDFDYNPVNSSFSEVDKFVIQKLYSDDFHKQFKQFMLANYSFRYYWVFTYKQTMRTIAIFVCIILAFLIFLFTYKPVLRRDYKRKYFSYLIPGLSLVFSIIIILNIYKLIATNSTLFYKGDFTIELVVVLLGAFFSTVLFFVERVFFIESMSLSKQLKLKVLFVFVVILLPLSIAIQFLPGYESRAFVVLLVIGITFAFARGTLLYFKNSVALELRQKEAELAVLREANSRAELQSLHARINPHFLYNSLNSIAGLVKSNPDKTEKMALSLSDMFRYLINRKNEVLTDVESEVEMVQSYLEIEQIRFGKRMRFSIEVDEDLKTKQIPKFILQPMVENAIKHGTSKIEGNGEISISIVQIENLLEIKVADNGPGFPEGLVAGYGLQSLYDLLKICYKDKAEVDWQNSPAKMIIVRIPLNENAN